MPEPTEDREWRQGRHQPQNLYADGRYVGVMFDPNHAWIVCEWMNQREGTVVDAELCYQPSHTDLEAQHAAALAIHRPCHTADTEPYGCQHGHQGFDEATGSISGVPDQPAVCMACTYDDRTYTWPCPTAQALGVTA